MPPCAHFLFIFTSFCILNVLLYIHLPYVHTSLLPYDRTLANKMTCVLLFLNVGTSYIIHHLPLSKSIIASEKQNAQVTYSNSTNSKSFCLLVFLNEQHLSKAIFYSNLNSGDVELNPGPKSFSFTHINVRSIYVNNDDIKLGNLQSCALDNKWDVLAITETWLDDTISNIMISLSGFQPPERNDRNRHGGGVMLYISTAIPYARRHDLEQLNSNCESIWIELGISNVNRIIFGLFYRPPNQSAVQRHTFCNEFTTSVSEALSSGASSVFVTGDFNDRCTSWLGDHCVNNSELGNRFRDLTHSIGLTQIVDFPTHVNNDGRPDHILDLVFTNSIQCISDCNCLPPILNCDHMFINVNTTFTFPNQPSFKRFVWDFKHSNFDALNILLANSPWDNILDSSLSIDDQANTFTKYVSNSAKIYIPFKQISVNPKDKPWMTSKLKMLQRKRNRLWKRYFKTKNPEHFDQYRRIRNNVTRENKKRKFNYNKQVLDQAAISPNSKHFWKLAKSILGKTTDSFIPPLLDQNDLITDHKQKARLFNEYFASQSSLPQDTNSIPLPPLTHLATEKLSSFKIEVLDTYKALEDLKSDKATGPDLIGNKMLKETSAAIAYPLTRIFNHCLCAGLYPASWKKSHTMPIFKKGDRRLVGNYRPISLLCNMSKVFERLIYNQLYNHLMKNHLLTPKNSGFKKGDGTINQLIYLTHEIYRAFENGNDVKFVFLDFSKAFDRVWHKGLLFKLEKMGVEGNLLKLLGNYLSYRQQRVVLNGQHSSLININAGVPQGSILGPLLFLVYINDLPDSIKCNINLFADDSTLWEVITDATESVTKLNSDLIRIQQWSDQWHMTLNPHKTEMLTFSSKVQKVHSSPLVLKNTIITEVGTHKHLGMTLSSNMSWKPHITNITVSAGKKINIMRKMSYRLNRPILMRLYTSYIRPVLEYGSVLFDDFSVETMDMLDSIQHHAALTCTGAFATTSKLLMLKEVGWQALSDRRKSSKLLYLYKITHGLVPTYLSEILTQLKRPYERETIRYNMRNAVHIRVPFSRTERYKKSFFLSTIILWNKLSEDVINSGSAFTFKNKLRAIYTTNEVPPKWYCAGRRRPNILHTRLRLNNSSLNANRFRLNIADSAACPCGAPIENSIHYITQCPLYNQTRSKLLVGIRDIIAPGVHPATLPALSNQYYSNLIIFGSIKLPTEDNFKIAAIMQTFIIESGRFDQLFG